MYIRILGAAALIALLASPAAHAQMPNINLIPEIKTLTPEEKEQQQQADKAYRESLRKIPDAKNANDPWGSVRAGDAPAPKASAAKPRSTQVKPRAKADSAAN